MVESIESYLTEKIIKRLESRKCFCWNNGAPEYMRMRKGEYTSYRVPGLITKITYPPNKNRDYSLTVYIHFIEYLINKKIESGNLSVNNFTEYQRLYNQVLFESQIPNEVDRFYDNFLRRKEFKDARIYGR